MAQMNEKEGGTVVELTNPVDDRIGNPKSKSNNRTTLLNFTNFEIGLGISYLIKLGI